MAMIGADHRKACFRRSDDPKGSCGVIGMSDGGELRRPLGVAIVGGLIVSQILTLYTTPVIYLYLDSFTVWLRTICGKQARREHGGSARGQNVGRTSLPH